MAEKEMLLADKSSMKHVYNPAIEEKKTKSFLLERFVDNMYNGSSLSLMMQLLGNKKTSQQEIAAIRDLLDKLENK